MNKKITKTIYLIVFVVLMQIFCKNVYAETGDVAVICEYGYSEGKIAIGISNNGDAKLTDDSVITGDLKNWNKAEKGFKGYDYFKSTTQCPPWGVVERNTLLYVVDLPADHFYVFDTDQKANDFKDKNDVVVQLTNTVINDNTRDDITSNTSNAQKITLPKICECTASSNGTQIYAKFTIKDPNVSPTTDELRVGKKDDTFGEDIQNWSEPREGYYYSQDLLANDKCPDYLLYYVGINNKLYASDAAHVSKLRQSLGANDTYQLACIDKRVTPKSNSNSNSNSNPESDIYISNPNVSSNVHPMDPGDMGTYRCGDGLMTGIPKSIPRLGKLIFNFIQILVPLIIIILGSIDLVKGLSAQKEDDIKKGQQIFFKRLLSAILVFFVFALSKLAISLVSKNTNSVFDCVDCIIRNNSSCVEE